MNPEVKDRLITGLAQYLSAQSAGSCKFAIADAYLAIDNYFSAILLDAGIDPTRNHLKKLELILSQFGNLIREAGTTEGELRQFYTWWQKVRYSSEVPTPNDTLNLIRLSSRVMSAITQKIACQHDKSVDKLEEELYKEVLGTRWSSFEEKCAEIHEMYQGRAEVLGEKEFVP